MAKLPYNRERVSSIRQEIDHIDASIGGLKAKRKKLKLELHERLDSLAETIHARPMARPVNMDTPYSPEN